MSAPVPHQAPKAARGDPGASLASKIAILTLACLMLWPVAAAALAGTAEPPTPGRALGEPLAPDTAQNPWLGIAHVSYLNGEGYGGQENRYVQATTAGAQWNRWAMYWTDIELSAGYFDYSAADGRVDADRAHGLQIDAVLMNTPAQYATAGVLGVPEPRIDRKLDPSLGSSAWTQRVAPGLGPMSSLGVSAAISPPANLYTPVFADGTDNFGVGKAINPGNPWAVFVNKTAQRYAGRVSAWEMWNEPDFSAFWSGSVADYTRLLKVGYLAAKSADPSATVLVGGMMYWEWVNRYGQEHAWLKAFLAQLGSDQSRFANSFYFDGIPWHWYSRASDVYWKTVSARSLLAGAGISAKAMWVNEANAPACGEPPPNATCGRPGDPGFDYLANGYKGSATVDEQASFVVQAAAYGLAAGLQRFFTFQHYDDGSGEAFGLFRNDGSARPAYAAYNTIAYHFRGATSATRYSSGDFEQVLADVFQDGQARRASVVWKRTAGGGSVRVPGTGTATLAYQNGQTQTVGSDGSAFTLWLAGATDNRNFGGDPNDYIIGGAPQILVGADLRPISGVATTTPVPPPSVTVTPSPTPTQTPTRTPSPTPLPPRVGGLLKNGGFETGGMCPDWWTCSDPTGFFFSADSHSGALAVVLGSIAGPISSVSQQITLPASGAPFLRFAYKYQTAEPPVSPGSDWHLWPDRFEVIVVDSAGIWHYDYVAGNATAGWTVLALDLAAYRGQTITVVFNLYQSSSVNPSQALVDDAEIYVTQLRFPFVPNASQMK